MEGKSPPVGHLSPPSGPMRVRMPSEGDASSDVDVQSRCAIVSTIGGEINLLAVDDQVAENGEDKSDGDLGALEFAATFAPRQTFGSTQAAVELVGKSLNMFPPDSPFRVQVARIVASRRWRVLCRVVIWVSLLCLMLEPRTIHGEARTRSQTLWLAFDWCVVFFYIADVVLNAIARGLIQRTGDVNTTYLGGGLAARLNFSVIVASVVLMAGFGLSGLHCLKTLDSLPHTYFHEMRSARAVVQALKRSSVLLVNNVTILCFFLYFFSLLAAEFFGNAMKYRCAIPADLTLADPLTGEWNAADFALDNLTILEDVWCSEPNAGWLGTGGCPSEPAYIIEGLTNITTLPPYKCVNVGNDEPSFVGHFDNIGAAWLTNIQVIQLENWGVVMRPLLRTRVALFVYWFFVLLIVTCTFILVNLFTAIVVLHLEELQQEMAREDPEDAIPLTAYEKFTWDLYAVLPEGCFRRVFPGAHAHIKQREAEAEAEAEQRAQGTRPDEVTAVVAISHTAADDGPDAPDGDANKTAPDTVNGDAAAGEGAVAEGSRVSDEAAESKAGGADATPAAGDDATNGTAAMDVKEKGSLGNGTGSASPASRVSPAASPSSGLRYGSPGHEPSRAVSLLSALRTAAERQPSATSTTILGLPEAVEQSPEASPQSAFCVGRSMSGRSTALLKRMSSSPQSLARAASRRRASQLVTIRDPEPDVERAAIRTSVFSIPREPTLLSRVVHYLNHWVVPVVILTNVAMLATKSVSSSEHHLHVLEVAEYCFLSFYICELAVNIFFERMDFFRHTTWWFEPVLIVAAFPALFVESWYVVRTLRVFRLLQLSGMCCSIFQTVNLEPILSLFYIIIVVVVLFAVIGRQFFYGLYDTERYPVQGDWLPPEWESRFHFDTLPDAALTLFLIMAGDNWMYPMYQALQATSSTFFPSLLYFYGYMILSNWILLSMFVAVLLQEFDIQRPIDKNIDNLSVVTESRSLFAGFLRKSDFNVAAQNVDEENLTSIVAVSNMLKWANRARAERMKQIAYYKKIQLNPADVAETARTLESSSVAVTLEHAIERARANRKNSAERTIAIKGANRWLKRDSAPGTSKFNAILHEAMRQQMEMEGMCADAESDLRSLQACGALANESKGVVRQLVDVDCFILHSRSLRRVENLPMTDAEPLWDDEDDGGEDALMRYPSRVHPVPDSPRSCSPRSPRREVSEDIRRRHSAGSRGSRGSISGRRFNLRAPNENSPLRTALATLAAARRITSPTTVAAAAGNEQTTFAMRAAAVPQTAEGRQGASPSPRADVDTGAGEGAAGTQAVHTDSGAAGGEEALPTEQEASSPFVRPGSPPPVDASAAEAPLEDSSREGASEGACFGLPAITIESERSQQSHSQSEGQSVTESQRTMRSSSILAQKSEGPPRSVVLVENSADFERANSVIDRSQSTQSDGRGRTTGKQQEQGVLQRLQLLAAAQPTGGWLAARNEVISKQLKRMSLFLFHELHPVRLFALSICNSRAFEVFILVVVLVSSFLQAFAPAGEAWGDDNGIHHSNSSRPGRVLIGDEAEGILSAVFLAIFTAEFMLKLVAYGFVWMARPKDHARRRERAYLLDPWNCLDFMILIVMWVTYGLRLSGSNQGLRSIRVFRVLRVLRIIRRVSSLRRLVQTLLHPQTLLRIGAVLTLAVFLYFSFGLISVALFAGRLGYCSDESVFLRTTCEGGVASLGLTLTPVEDGRGFAGYMPLTDDNAPLNDPFNVLPNFTALDATRGPGYLVPFEWVTPKRNFDTISSAMLSLIVIASGEDWGTPMLRTIDSTSSSTGPIRDSNPWYVLFFILYMVLMSFLVVNLVIFVITDAIRTQSGVALLIPEQVEWVDLLNHINVIRPLPRIPPPERDPVTRELTTLGRIRSRLLVLTGLRNTWQKTAFTAVITLFILANVVIITLDYAQSRDKHRGDLVDYVGNGILLAVYIVEACIKIVSLRPSCYFQDKWNRLDFAVVVGSVLSVILGQASVSGGALQVVVLFRVFRVFYIFKAVKVFPGIAFLFDSIVASIPAIANVLLIVVLFLWIWAAIGMELFGALKDRSAIVPEYNYRSFPAAIRTLTLVITADDWITLMTDSMLDSRECSTQPPRWVGSDDGGADVDLSQGFNDCGSTYAATFYYVSFFFLGAYIFLNVVTAAIVDEVRHAISRGNFRVSADEIEGFRRCWYMTLHGTNGAIPRWRMAHLMESLFFQNKLGIHPIYHKKLFNAFMLQLDWQRLRLVASRSAVKDDEQSAVLRMIWPPPLWESFRFHDVLSVLCHNAYEHIAISPEEVEEHRSFQKRSDRLLATQVIQSVVRCICTLHLLERDRYPGFVITDEQKQRLKVTRDHIRKWKADIAERMREKTSLGKENRLFHLPKVIQEVTEVDDVIDARDDLEARRELLDHMVWNQDAADDEEEEEEEMHVRGMPN